MREHIDELVRKALTKAQDAGDLPPTDDADIDIALERPADSSHGDWTSTFALKSAKVFKRAPRQIAAALVEHFPEDDAVKNVEIAGPGFINVTLTTSALMQVVTKARQEKDHFGRSNVGKGQHVNVEFVSANPVGPMHVGHGRWAALGDSLCNIMEHAGYKVTREFYINDAGVQMDTFAYSIELRYRELLGEEIDTSELGYGGSYIVDIAQAILDEKGSSILGMQADKRHDFILEFGYKRMLEEMHETLLKARTEFDVWTSERTLHEPDAEGNTAITNAFKRLEEKGYLYKDEGALWFKSTEFGDDKDRVLVKADGNYTYLAADVAYHEDKFARGASHLIDIWGADHHGYIARMNAAITALGHPGAFEVLLGQLVNLFSGGEAVRMSKRRGTMVMFEELLDEVGVDATRFILVSRDSNQEIDFDIDLAKSQSQENPVYYVQYAHARICSVMRRAAGENNRAHVTESADQLSAVITARPDLSLLTDPAEAELARKLDSFDEVVGIAAVQRMPSRLATYATELAAVFHQFYTRCHVITDDKELTMARLALCDATRIVLARALSLIGVSAPLSM